MDTGGNATAAARKLLEPPLKLARQRTDAISWSKSKPNDTLLTVDKPNTEPRSW